MHLVSLEFREVVMITRALPVAGSCGRVKSAPERVAAANMRGY